MSIFLISENQYISPSKRTFEVVERKGIGHPDALSDLLADEFSKQYSQLTLNRYGLIPNHWVDKVNIVGGTSNVTFGGFEMKKTINCYLFGKVTERIGEDYINIMQLFESSVKKIFDEAIGHKDILKHVKYQIDNSRSVGVDHDPKFYQPDNSKALEEILRRESVANDTVYCVGYYPFSLVETITIELENYINSKLFKKDFPEVGSDVKVLINRYDNQLDITLCIPFHPELTPNPNFYHTKLKEITNLLSNKIPTLFDVPTKYKVSLSVNTKDTKETGYLTPFGTSLGKGDCGLVGRGNRYNGLISAFRPSGVEAAAGKNPVHHAGKIYSALTQDISFLIHQETGESNQVTISARNGHLLDKPAFIHIDFEEKVSPATKDLARDIALGVLQKTSDYSKTFLSADPIMRFRHSYTSNSENKLKEMEAESR